MPKQSSNDIKIIATQIAVNIFLLSFSAFETFKASIVIGNKGLFCCSFIIYLLFGSLNCIFIMINLEKIKIGQLDGVRLSLRLISLCLYFFLYDNHISSKNKYKIKFLALVS